MSRYSQQSELVKILTYSQSFFFFFNLFSNLVNVSTFSSFPTDLVNVWNPKNFEPEKKKPDFWSTGLVLPKFRYYRHPISKFGQHNYPDQKFGKCFSCPKVAPLQILCRYQQWILKNSILKVSRLGEVLLK